MASPRSVWQAKRHCHAAIEAGSDVDGDGDGSFMAKLRYVL